MSALFIILVSLMMTLFSEKVLIYNRCISGLMPNLIKKSWTDSCIYATCFNFLLNKLYFRNEFKYTYFTNLTTACWRSQKSRTNPKSHTHSRSAAQYVLTGHCRPSTSQSTVFTRTFSYFRQMALQNCDREFSKSRAKNSFSLDKISLILYENFVCFWRKLEQFCALRSFRNNYNLFLLKFFRKLGFRKFFCLSLAKNPWV